MPGPNQTFRGASLYSGIFDTQDPTASNASNPAAPVSRSTQTSSGASQEADSSTLTPKSGSDAAGPSNKSSGWSAALRFAPRRSVAAAKPKARPNAAFVASFTPAAATVEALPQSSLSRAPGAPPKQPSSSSPSAPQALPTLASATGASPSMGETERAPVVAVVDTSGLKLTALALPSTDSDDAWLASELAKRPVTSPPPYTLPPEEIERDKLLIRRAAAARGQAQYHEREPDFAAEEDDDDVNGFFATNAGKRAAAKRKKKRRRGASPPIGPNLNAEYDPRVPSDYLAYKQQVYDRRAAEVEFQRWQEQQDGNIYRDHDEDQWVEEQDDEEQEDQGMRALNRVPPPRSSEDTRPSAEASAKEAEVEKGAVISSMSMPEIVAPGGSAKAMTGEEAYARRVAMSAMSGEEAYQRRFGLSQQAAAQPTRSAVQPPGPPPGPPPGVPPTLAVAQLRARQTAAAAIAARLAKVVAPSDAQVNASGSTTAGAGVGDGDPSTFAERLMHKYGHVSGQGLGVEGNRGIATPLTIQPATHTKGRARIVNPDHTEAQRARDTALYGSSTASPIIALLNMATHSDLESNSARHDLIHDIRSECNKFGIIHHIFPHTTPSSQPKRDKEVRVFVQFTGPAASWKAVRALEGRWFQGRQVQAFYYDQEAFERGDFNRPLIRPPLPSGPPM